MRDRSNRCNRPVRFPIRDNSRSSFPRLVSRSGATSYLSVVVELYAKSVESHGQQRVAADREHVVHPLAVVQSLPERGPRLVGQLRFLVELVDPGDHRTLERLQAAVATAAHRGYLFVAESRLMGQLYVMAPFVGAVAAMRDAQDGQ